MKTAEEILIDCYSYYGNFNDIKDIEDEITDEGVKAALEAMETYTTQQTSDLTTQLAKANSDKERLGELLKVEYNTCIEKANGWGQVGEEELQKNRLKQADEILQTLQDCGITL
jgi:hypothetical protein